MVTAKIQRLFAQQCAKREKRGKGESGGGTEKRRLSAGTMNEKGRRFSDGTMDEKEKEIQKKHR